MCFGQAKQSSKPPRQILHIHNIDKIRAKYAAPPCREQANRSSQTSPISKLLVGIQKNLNAFVNFRKSVVTVGSPTTSRTHSPAVAPSTTSLSLIAPFAGGYGGAAGNMFDIKAAKDLSVTNFAVHGASASMVTVEIYKKTRTGQFLGTQSDSTKWTKIGQATFQTKAQGLPSILPEGSFAPVFVKQGWRCPGFLHHFYGSHQPQSIFNWLIVCHGPCVQWWFAN